MSHSILSQEEINALISKHPDAEEISGSQDSSADKQSQVSFVPEIRRNVSQASKVMFNTIEPMFVKRKDTRIEELNHVTFDVRIMLGETTLSVGELLNLQKDSLIVLNQMVGENARLLVNGKYLAEGETVVLNDCFAFRLNKMGDKKKALSVNKHAEGEESN